MRQTPKKGKTSPEKAPRSSINDLADRILEVMRRKKETEEGGFFSRTFGSQTPPEPHPESKKIKRKP